MILPTSPYESKILAHKLLRTKKKTNDHRAGAVHAQSIGITIHREHVARLNVYTLTDMLIVLCYKHRNNIFDFLTL